MLTPRNLLSSLVLPRTSVTVGNVSSGGRGRGGKNNMIWFDRCLGFEPRAVGSRRLKVCAIRCGVRLAKGLCAGKGGGDSESVPYFNDTLEFVLN